MPAANPKNKINRVDNCEKSLLHYVSAADLRLEEGDWDDGWWLAHGSMRRPKSKLNYKPVQSKPYIDKYRLPKLGQRWSCHPCHFVWCSWFFSKTMSRVRGSCNLSMGSCSASLSLVIVCWLRCSFGASLSRRPCYSHTPLVLSVGNIQVCCLACMYVFQYIHACMIVAVQRIDLPIGSWNHFHVHFSMCGRSIGQLWVIVS